MTSKVIEFNSPKVKKAANKTTLDDDDISKLLKLDPVTDDRVSKIVDILDKVNMINDTEHIHEEHMDGFLLSCYKCKFRWIDYNYAMEEKMASNFKGSAHNLLTRILLDDRVDNKIAILINNLMGWSEELEAMTETTARSTYGGVVAVVDVNKTHYMFEVIVSVGNAVPCYSIRLSTTLDEV